MSRMRDRIEELLTGDIRRLLDNIDRQIGGLELRFVSKSVRARVLEHTAKRARLEAEAEEILRQVDKEERDKANENRDLRLEQRE